MGRRKRKGRMKPWVMRPWSIGRCPTGDELRTAWANRRRSQKDFIWLLSVLGELTCFTDCNLEHLGGFGNIAGRKGGLKAFLAQETPELVGKYKSIARYSRLAYRLKMAFAIYPPMALSLLHPDLPLPERNMAFLTNHARKVYREHLADLPPKWKAFDEVVHKRLVTHPRRHQWGPPLPRSEWAKAEQLWRNVIIRPKALRKIRADHSFYARDYISPEYWVDKDHMIRLYPGRQAPDEEWLERKRTG